MWEILKISGKCPISNKLLKSLDIENEMGVDNKLINFPDIPQYERLDFLIFLIILPTSKGLLFIAFRSGTPSIGCR